MTMSLRRFILAALAVGMVNAACNEDVEIKNNDVSKLNGCSTYEGKITVNKDCTNVQLPDNLNQLKGDLVVEGAADLASISGKGLESIEGTMSLKELTILKTLSFPELTSVKEIKWITLPALTTIGFTKQVTSAEKVEISNTNLESLSGINLKKAAVFNINNNNFLKTVDVALGNVTDALTVAFNAKGVNASFPNLQNAQNITIRDAGSISFPKLEKVTSSISFINNTFETANFPKLSEVGQSIAFVSCTELTNLTADSLKSVGGTFQLANNTKLETVDGFDDLEKVGGSIDLSGVFEKVELPDLSTVSGSFNLQSTGKLDCKPFQKLKDDGKIRGNNFVCKSEAETASSSEGSVSTGGGSGGSKSDDDKKGSAGRTTVSIALAGFSAAFALMAL